MAHASFSPLDHAIKADGISHGLLSPKSLDLGVMEHEFTEGFKERLAELHAQKFTRFDILVSASLYDSKIHLLINRTGSGRNPRKIVGTLFSFAPWNWIRSLRQLLLGKIRGRQALVDKLLDETFSAIAEMEARDAAVGRHPAPEGWASARDYSEIQASSAAATAPKRARRL